MLYLSELIAPLAVVDDEQLSSSELYDTLFNFH